MLQDILLWNDSHLDKESTQGTNHSKRQRYGMSNLNRRHLVLSSLGSLPNLKLSRRQYCKCSKDRSNSIDFKISNTSNPNSQQHQNKRKLDFSRKCLPIPIAFNKNHQRNTKQFGHLIESDRVEFQVIVHESNGAYTTESCEHSIESRHGFALDDSHSR